MAKHKEDDIVNLKSSGEPCVILNVDAITGIYFLQDAFGNFYAADDLGLEA